MTPRALDCFVERVLRDALDVTRQNPKYAKYIRALRLKPEELEKIIRDNMNRGER